MAAAFLLAGSAGGGGGVWLGNRVTGGSAPGSATGNLMGLSTVPARPAPPISLTDQSGRPLTLAALRGRVVVLDFFDDRCIDLCPLVADELILAERHLGAAGRRVAFVAVNVDAAHASVADVRAFTDQHGLNRLPQWYFLTGPITALERIWSAYDVEVQVATATGVVYHSTPMYFIGPGGEERAVADPQDVTLPDGRGYLPAGQIAQWGTGIAGEVRSLLRGD